MPSSPDLAFKMDASSLLSTRRVQCLEPGPLEGDLLPVPSSTSSCRSTISRLPIDLISFDRGSADFPAYMPENFAVPTAPPPRSRTRELPDCSEEFSSPDRPSSQGRTRESDSQAWEVLQVFHIYCVYPYDHWLVGGLLKDGSGWKIYLIFDVWRRTPSAVKVTDLIDLSEELQETNITETLILSRIKERRQQNALSYLPEMHRACVSSADYLHLETDYCPYGDLGQFRGRLTAEEVIMIAAELISGLAGLHSIGVAHQDLKPAHVLIDRDLHCVITGFRHSQFLPQDYDTFVPAKTNNRSSRPNFAADVRALGETMSSLWFGERTRTRVTKDLRDLLSMLEREPDARPPLVAIIDHPAFKNMNIRWENVHTRQSPSPFSGRRMKPTAARAVGPGPRIVAVPHEPPFLDRARARNLMLPMSDEFSDLMQS